MMVQKRILSFFLICLLLVTYAIPTTVFAAGELIDPNQKVVYRLVYMKDVGDNRSSIAEDVGIKSGTDGGGNNYYEAVKPDQLAVGDIVCIGLQIDFMDNMTTAGTGLYGLSYPVIVNQDYLLVEPNGAGTASWPTGTINTIIDNRMNIPGSFYEAVINEDTGYAEPGKAGYKLASFVKNVAGSQYVGMSDIDNGRIYTLQYTYDVDNSDPEHPDSASGWPGNHSSFMAGIMRFKVKAIPPAGTKVMEIGRTPELYLTTGGSSGTQYAYYTEGQEGKNMKDFVIFDEAAAVLFPATYTVNYDANSTKFTGADFAADATKEETVPEGNKPTLQYDDSGVKKDISSQLTPPTGMVFEGWYLDEDCTQKFDTSTVIDQTNFPPVGGTDYSFTVYAKYEPGYAVEFDGNGTNAGTDDNGATNVAGKFPQKHQKANGVALLTAGQTIKDNLLGGYDPYKAGYNFKGWFEKNTDGSMGAQFDETEAQRTDLTSKTVYASWEMTDTKKTETNSWKIKFDKNTTAVGTDASPTEMYFEKDSTLAASTGFMPTPPTRTDDYTFKGWYVDKSGDGAKVELGTTLDDAIIKSGVSGVDYNETTREFTVYARWDKATTGDPDKPTDDPLVPDDDAVTVKFDAGSDGTANPAIKAKAIKLGGVIEHMPANPTPKNPAKAFDGWYADLATTGDIKVVENTTPIDTTMKDDLTNVALAAKGTITLHAKYIDKIEVTINPNGGTIAAGDALTSGYTKEADGSVKILVDPNSNLPTMPTVDNRASYDNPPKWYLRVNSDPTGTLKEINAGNIGDAGNKITEASTLFAVWNYTGGDKITVTFDANGTTPFPAVVNPDGTQDKLIMGINPADTLTALPGATRDNYVFKRWDFVKNASQSSTATAYTGAPLNTAPGNGYIKPDSTVTVYAIWDTDTEDTVKDVTISFDMNKPAAATGTVSPASIDNIVMDYGDVIGPRYPDDPELDGYAFVGWYLDANATIPETGAIDKDTTVFDDTLPSAGLTGTGPTPNAVTLYAKWEETVDVTFHANGGSYASGLSMTIAGVKPGDTIAAEPAGLNMPTAGGSYTHKWNTKPDGSGTDFVTVAEATPGNSATPVDSTFKDLYAIWTYTGTDKITITFDGNGSGTNPATLAPAAPATMVVAPGQTITAAQMPTATRSNYTFAHWDFKPNPLYGVDSSYVYTDTVATNATAADKGGLTLAGNGSDKFTLYATWTATTAPVTVDFYVDSAAKTEGTKYATVSLTSGDVVGTSMPANPTMASKTFKEWQNNADGTVFTDATTVSANIDVVGQWDTNPVITFEAGVGTFPSNGKNKITLEVPYNSTWAAVKTMAGFPDEPTRDKHTLRKETTGDTKDFWYETTTAGLTPDPVENTDTFTADTTLHACWDAKVYIELKNATIDYAGKNYDPFDSANTTATNNKYTIYGQDAAGNKDTSNILSMTYMDINRFTVTYTLQGATPATPENRINGVGTYDIEYASNSADPYTAYEVKGTDSLTVNKRAIGFTFTHTGPIQVAQDALTAGSYGAQMPAYNLTDSADQTLLDAELGTTFSIANDTKWIMADKPATGDPSSYPYDSTKMAKAYGDYILSVELLNGLSDNFDVTLTNEALTIDPTTHTVTFKFNGGTLPDTAPGAAAGATISEVTYTVEHGKAISDTNAATMPDPATTGATIAVTTLPGYDSTVTPGVEGGLITPPTDQMFINWFEGTSAPTDDTGLTAFTATTQVTSNIIVWAYYEASNDATLKIGTVQLKENDKTGTDVEYRDSTYAVPATPIVFDPATEIYYARLDNDVANAWTLFETTQLGSSVEVKVNGGSALMADATDGSYTAPLNEASNGSTNTLEVTVTAPDGTTTKTYTFNLQRLAEAKIELNYGNSPYGMIMRDENIADADKDTAKSDFAAGNQFTSNYLPQGAPKLNDNVIYTLSAWFDNPDTASADDIDNPDLNMDRNEYALFVYNWAEFDDPGFTATDSLGNDVTSTISRSITVKRAKDGIYGESVLQDSNVEDEVIAISASNAGQLHYDNITYDGSKAICPGKYELTYEFIDTTTNTTCRVKRYVVVLLKLGDSTFDNFITGQDIDSITNISKGAALPSNNVYTYRVLDTTFDQYITGQDVDYISGVSKGSAEKAIYPLP